MRWFMHRWPKTKWTASPPLNRSIHRLADPADVLEVLGLLAEELQHPLVRALGLLAHGDTDLFGVILCREDGRTGNAQVLLHCLARPCAQLLQLVDDQPLLSQIGCFACRSRRGFGSLIY